tara:strand:+ start:1052 stop:1261 length:210 start_codon:yes stop_codon:yes gene_type:complete
MDKIRVENRHSLYRDSETGAILNCNDSEYDSYLRSKNIAAKKKNEIDQLKSDVGELKDMMKIILEKLDK